MNPDNPVALVLGAIKGIGRGIGLALAQKNVRVALNYYDWEDSLDDLKQTFSGLEDRYRLFQTDLRSPRHARELVQKVMAHYGRLDILINNIERGGWPVVHGPYVESQWDLEMETTLRAKWWICDAAMPFLKASGNGVVINLSSIAGIVGRFGPASLIFNDGYAAANRAISSFTETWARVGAPEVRVNEIMLGIFQTRHAEATRGWGLLTAAQQQAIRDHTLLGRTGTISDVVKSVLFMIDDAPFMTGTVMRLDGGYVLGGERVQPIPEGVV
jgi:3-oxoacyl-[acyl-carrier protein] reductase